MHALEIPLYHDIPHYQAEMELFGHSFIFEFEVLEREAYMVLHVYDPSAQPLALGIRLIPRWPLFRHKNIELMMLENTLIAYEVV
jgi:hypothetical protein